MMVDLSPGFQTALSLELAQEDAIIIDSVPPAGDSGGIFVLNFH